MSNQNLPTYDGQAHFRIPAGFMPQVHRVARRKGLTASGFMRMAILDAVHRSGDSPVGQKQGVGTK